MTEQNERPAVDFSDELSDEALDRDQASTAAMVCFACTT
jgi:hypothetical protein